MESGESEQILAVCLMPVSQELGINYSNIVL